MTTHFESETRDLASLLKLDLALRDAGLEAQALALGPSLLLAYFEAEHGYMLNPEHPRTFTEKLYTRMLAVHAQGCPTFTRLADKLAVREHVKAAVGPGYLSELLWQGSDANEIERSQIPAGSFLKCSEGSGKLLRLTPTVSTDQIKALSTQWQTRSHYWFRREFHYWPRARQLLIEAALDDGHPDGPLDYIFYCFDGVPRLVQVGSSSHSIHCFYDTDWGKLSLSYRDHFESPDLPRPSGLDEMLAVASKLSAGFDFVRVDLYDCHGRVRFGELTFTPRAGKLPWQPGDWDFRMGDWWRYTGLADG